MGKKEILKKLTDKFRHIPKSEEDAVYVLSRVRKILELDGHPEKYSILNFYCNLALHSKITRPPKIVIERLEKIRAGSDYSNSIVGFADFHGQLKAFLVEHKLPNFYEIASESDVQDFNRVLNSVYSHTPIVTEVVTKYQTSIDKNGVISGAPIEEE